MKGKTVEVRLSSCIIALLVLSNITTVAFLLKTKVHLALQETTTKHFYHLISNSIQKIDNLKKEVKVIHTQNNLAYKNKEVHSETRAYVNAESDRELLNQCGKQLRRMRRGYSLLKEDIWRKRRRFKEEEKRLLCSFKNGKSSMDYKLLTQYNN